MVGPGHTNGPAFFVMNDQPEMLVDMPFPLQGRLDTVPLLEMPKEHTSHGQNVRFHESLTERGRGGSRSGLSKYLSESLGSVIQGMFIVVRTDENALGWSFEGREPSTSGTYGGLGFEDPVPPPVITDNPGSGGGGYPPVGSMADNYVIYFAILNEVDPPHPDPPLTPSTLNLYIVPISGEVLFGSITNNPIDNLSTENGVTTVTSGGGTASYIDPATPTSPPLSFSGTNINNDGSDLCNWNTEEQNCRIAIPSGTITAQPVGDVDGAYVAHKWWSKSGIATSYVPLSGTGAYDIDLSTFTYTPHSISRASLPAGTTTLRVRLTAGDRATGYLKVIKVARNGDITVLREQSDISVDTGTPTQNFTFTIP